MSTKIAIATALTTAALLACPSLAAEIPTYLFPHRDGESGNSAWHWENNYNQTLEIGRAQKKNLAWITFRTAGIDVSKAIKSSLILHVENVNCPGTLKIYALTAPVPPYEKKLMREKDISFSPAKPVDTIYINESAEERIVRLDLGKLLQQGTFHGLALVGHNGLRAEFDSKDSDLPTPDSTELCLRDPGADRGRHPGRHKG